jgi:hypothetical protein
LQARTDGEIDAELQGLAKGFAHKVKSYTVYDVNGYRFHTRDHAQSRPNRKTTNTGVHTPGTDGLDYYGLVDAIYEPYFDCRTGPNPVVFKCHWFDPNVTRTTPELELVEIRQDSVYQGEDVQEKVCKKLVSDLHHEARLQCIINHAADVLGEVCHKDEARKRHVTKEEYMARCPDWCRTDRGC